MSFGSAVSGLSDIVGDIGSVIGQQYYDPEHPIDSMALMPFIGTPIGYHVYREGRSNPVATLSSLIISVGTTEALFLMAGRAAGFTSTEWALGRGLSALGVRVGGRSYMHAFLRGSTGMGAWGWGVPLWAQALLGYEAYRWLDAQGVTPRYWDFEEYPDPPPSYYYGVEF